MFSECLACETKVSHWTKCLFLNEEPYMVGPTLIDLNPIELKNYPFIISVINVLGVAMSFLQRYVFQKKQKT